MKDRTISKQVFVWTIVLVIWGLVAVLQTNAASLLDSDANTASTKGLHFPLDQCMGRLSVEDPQLGSSYLELGRDLSLPLGLDPKRLALGGDSDFVAMAQGDVVVPAGLNIQLITVLRPRREDFTKLSQGSRALLRNRFSSDPQDLSGLSGLGPNDLYKLNVSSMIARADADQHILSPISCLTGLQILCLNKTGVTAKGMKLLKEHHSLRALELNEERIGISGFTALKNLPALEYLDLNTGIDDASLKQVAQMPNLRWLRIRTGKIRGPGLAELKNLPRLERLCIWGTSPISDRHIKHLEGLKQIKSLTLWGSACNTLTDASLSSISKLKNLEELYFIRTRTRFTPAGVSHLKELENLKKVDFVQIWISPAGVYYGDEVVRQLASNLPNLESIEGIGFLSAEGMKILSRLQNLKCLGIALKDNRQGYYGPTGLSHLTHLSSLEELHITSGESLSDVDIASLELLSNLRDLHISSQNVTNRSLTSIGKLKKLENLHLNCPVTCSGLNQLSGLTNLQTLDVEEHPAAISPSDRGKLDLSTLTKLNTLTLSGLSLHDADLESLAGLHHLEWLSLGGTFTQEGFRHLSNLHELKRLSISGIFCTAGEHLGNLRGLTKLGNLVLRGRITDDALGNLSGLSSIWSLRVETDEPIRPETVARLKQAMPTITYIHIDNPPQTMQPTNRQQRERNRVSPLRANQRNRQRRR